MNELIIIYVKCGCWFKAKNYYYRYMVIEIIKRKIKKLLFKWNNYFNIINIGTFLNSIYLHSC